MRDKIIALGLLTSVVPETLPGILIAALISWLFLSGQAEAVIPNPNNAKIKECLQETGDSFETYNFTEASYCYNRWKSGEIKKELTELRDFLAANPRYRFPGQSQNRCWGKPREMPFESAYIEKNGDGFTAGVSYKDTMPAGCYENGPWDNRYGN
jgi:hypothetical protein|tara:strand:+ start:721 stop:1185 length:465 start_codon:yes stop_codon:yes gene_type:complete